MTNLDLMNEWINNQKNITMIKRYIVKDTNALYFRRLLTSLILDDNPLAFQMIENIFENIFNIKKDTKQFLLELGFNLEFHLDPFNFQKIKNINYLKDNWYSNKEELLLILTKTRSYCINTNDSNEVFLDDLFRYYELEANSWLVAAISNDYEDIDKILNSIYKSSDYELFIQLFIKNIYNYINKNSLQKQSKYFTKPFVVKRNHIIEFKESSVDIFNVIYFPKNKNSKRIQLYIPINSNINLWSIIQLIQLLRIDIVYGWINKTDKGILDVLELLKQKKVDISTLNTIYKNSTNYEMIIQKYLLDSSYFDYLGINLVIKESLFNNKEELFDLILELEKKELKTIKELDNDKYVFLIQIMKILMMKINIISF